MSLELLLIWRGGCLCFLLVCFDGVVVVVVSLFSWRWWLWLVSACKTFKTKDRELCPCPLEREIRFVFRDVFKVAEVPNKFPGGYGYVRSVCAKKVRGVF